MFSVNKGLDDKRNQGLDMLRVTASFFVVGTHVLGVTLLSSGMALYSAEWWITSVIRMIFVTAVPLFILISGYFLLDKEICSFKDFYRKRFKKILIPYFLYSLIYVLLQLRHSVWGGAQPILLSK